MSYRLLVRAAVLVAAISIASAQNAPGGVGQEDGSQGTAVQEQGQRERAIQDRNQAGEQGRAGQGEEPELNESTQEHEKVPVQAQVERRERRQAQVQEQQQQQQQQHRSTEEIGRAQGQHQARQVRVSLTSEQRRDGALHLGRAEIREMQMSLNRQGFNVGEPDGVLGRRTKEALTALQKQRGFQATGKADRATLDALNAGNSGGATPEASQGGGEQDRSMKEGGGEPTTTGQGGPQRRPPEDPPPASAAPADQQR